MSDQVLFYPPKREDSFLARLRALCLAEMKRLGDEEVGRRLNLRQGGVERLHWDSTWEAERAIRIAILLDIPAMQALEKVVEHFPVSVT
jgi:hypothetical protein